MSDSAVAIPSAAAGVLPERWLRIGSAAIGLECRRRGASVRIDAPEGWEGAVDFALPVALPDTAGAESRERAERILGWLWRAVRVARGAGVWEAEPEGQPRSVCEVAGAVLRPYRVEGGQVRLAGCSFEPRPLLGLVPRGGGTAEAPARWFGTDGTPQEEALVERLGLGRLVPAERRLRAGERAELDRWREASIAQLGAGEAAGQASFAVVAWCRWASGKVTLNFPTGSGQVAFAGWAIDFLSGWSEPPPFRCPASGLESYEALALPDGTVTVPEAVGRCEGTGRRVLRHTLQSCVATGRRASPEAMLRCPVTGGWVVPEAAVRCAWCGRLVAPGACVRGRCRDCRALEPVGEAERPVVLAKQLVPEAAGCRDWQVAESGGYWVVVGRRVASQALVVIEREAGRLVRRGFRRRWGGPWRVDDGKA